MPKPIRITKEMVDKTAFELVRTEGMDALTARNIADKVGCSTQPIYKVYQNLDALRENTVRIVFEYAENIIKHYHKTTMPFLNTGLGLIHFAATEKVLFRVFNIENYLERPIFGPLEDKQLYKLMEDMLMDTPLTTKERCELFLNTMIYTNGLAHLSYSGQLNMTEKQVAERLVSFFINFSGIKLNEEIYL